MVAKGFRNAKLRDVCDRITVGHVGPMADRYTQNGVPFLRSQNIAPFRLLLNDIKFIPPEFHAQLRKSELRPGDVAVVRTGYPGTACVIPDGFSELNCADLVVITPSRSLNPYYLAAIFNSAWGMASVAGNLVGVAQQHFNVGAAREMEVRLPSRPVQDRIAAILSTYDELIENSQRRIKIVETMARTLYREWFVHFRFPGQEKVPLVASPLGKTPKGWEVKLVAESFEISGGGTPSRKQEEYWEDGTIQWFSPSDLTAAGTIFMDDSSDHITQLGLAESSARLFPAHSVMLTSRATIGAIAINTHEACTNQGFITCLPNKRMPLYFLFHWLKENVPTFQRMASGATFKEISRGVFKTIELVHPPAELVRRFECTVVPMATQALALQRQARNLRRARDLLLPRLLSGQVRLNGDAAEHQLAAVPASFPPSPAPVMPTIKRRSN
jgi:type I restriction enzyme S subunit